MPGTATIQPQMASIVALVCDALPTLLLTRDGALRMPAELADREEIRAWGERVPALVDYLVQPRTRARSSWTATPRPAAPTSKSSAVAATAGRG